MFYHLANSHNSHPQVCQSAHMTNDEGIEGLGEIEYDRISNLPLTILMSNNLDLSSLFRNPAFLSSDELLDIHTYNLMDPPQHSLLFSYNKEN